MFIERLERRQLLAGQLEVRIDDGTTFQLDQSHVLSGPSAIVDFETMVVGDRDGFWKKTLQVKNVGDAPFDVTLGAHSATKLKFEAAAGSPLSDEFSYSGTLARGATYLMRIVYPTDEPDQFPSDQLNGITVTGAGKNVGIRIRGQVVAANVAQSYRPSFVNDRFSQSGEVHAFEVIEGNPQHIRQTSDAGIFFQLDSPSDVTLTTGGHTVTPTSGSATLRYLLTADASPIGQLDLAERTHGTEWFTDDIIANAAPKVVRRELPAGHYILQVQIEQLPTRVEFGLGFDVSVSRRPLAQPAVAVSGRGVAIANGDTTPRTTDGTSFGTAVADPLPMLSFKISNAGMGTLKANVNVSGDFGLVTGFPAEGLEHDDAPGEIIVRLRSGRAGAGSKAGQIIIDPADARVPNFIFNIGGTVIAPFATLVGGKLLVNGTDSRDTIRLVPSGPTLNVTRNGRTIPLSTRIIRGIAVNCRGGDDLVSTSTSLRIPVTLLGGAGSDALRAGNGNDLLSGGDGNDFLNGLGGNDTLMGDAGNDRLDGGAGANSLVGGDGNDTLILVLNNLKDIVNGGAGTDTLAGKDALDLVSLVP